MKAKPIGADSPESLQAALKESTADGFTPTLAIVFISIRQDCAAITEILHSQGIDVIYEMMADDLNALLDNLHLDSCYVIGWSDSGINGLLLALRHPEKVKNLAITGANLWPDSTAVDSSSKVKQTPDVKNQYKLMAMMTKEPNITLEQLHAIKCPTLVIGGDYDALQPKNTLLIAEAIPQSYLWIIPKSGHSTPVNYSKQFNETIDDFLKSHTGSLKVWIN